MKIFYDYQIFSTQRYGGISRYFYEIMKDKDYILPIVFNRNAYLKKGINFKGQTRIYNTINFILTISYLKKSQYDIFHPTYYNPYFLKYIKTPFVLTIHDMIHERFPKLMNPNDKTAIRKKLLANKAQRIIAVSNKTKEDVIKILNIPESKVDVIYHGSDFNKINSNKEFSKKLPKRYIIFTGNRRGYKNFHNFVESIKDFLKKEDLYLVCAGGEVFNNEEEKFLKENEIDNKVLQFFCNDEELKALYENALFFVFPSLYEGFGIPLLEAMGSNCPILCSNTSCFPEIVQDSAVFFNPYDVDDMKEKINFALNNDLTEYIKRGQDRFKHFSWDKARNETMESYKKIL